MYKVPFGHVCIFLSVELSYSWLSLVDYILVLVPYQFFSPQIQFMKSLSQLGVNLWSYLHISGETMMLEQPKSVQKRSQRSSGLLLRKKYI